METGRKVAMVTGGARRVGRGICLGLHKKGYNVVIHCNKSVDDANELRNILNNERNDSATVIVQDLSENIPQSAEKLIRDSATVWNRLDCVVNNASNFISNTLHDVTEEEFDSSLSVNLKASSGYLKESKGVIINISDLVGLKAKDSHFSHAISKAGLISATKNAALALAPEKWLKETPLQKIGTPEDVAGLVCFLASEEANFITGQILSLDGGRSLVF
ncbi:3-oxoacyl-[acyl-carrier-protein] reductase FabG [Armadillidium vulgare]|nr:3-oxoacyl-[acyl-carrier-protein] reductase FabG [Armadillidium vulgare]